MNWERFYSKISKPDKNGCWNWKSSLTKQGYAYFWHSEEEWPRVAHRIYYLKHIGKVPDGLVLDHLCRNRKCVNPKHLEPVSQAENVFRGESVWAINKRKTHCIRGHPFSEENTRLLTRTWRKTGKIGHSRQCKQCLRDWMREYSRRNRMKQKITKHKTK